ncbi:MAG TPA: hypothetical protein VN522_01025 [Solirubrobacterales bacterium]|nr:hypothetical protein [Solirubrobacterales bacterium]
MRLALSFSSWVNRRVEHFDFIDGRTVRRQMSVDFTLPEEPGFEDVQEVMVPVMVLRKEVMRGIDVTDAGGRSLSVVESGQARDITLNGLAGIGERLPRLRTPLPRTTLDEILKAKRATGADLAEQALAQDGDIREALRPVQRSQRERLTALIGELGEGFMLLVSVPYTPGESGLIKVSYDARLESSLRQSASEFGLRGAAYFLLSRFFSSFGLVGRAEYFNEIPLRLGRSYHAEVVPAAGTYAEEASLTLEKPKKGSVHRAPRAQVTKDVHRDFNHSRPHLLDNPDGGTTDRSEQGFLEVILHAKREGLIFPLLFSAGVIAGVLAFVSRQAQLDRLDGITLGALLLAPVALAAYYARSDENGYLTTAMRGVRYVGTTAVLAGVVVIGLLALGYVQPHGDGVESDPDAMVIVRCAGRVSLACTVALALALIAPFVNEFARWVIVGVDSTARRVDPGITIRDLALLLAPPAILITAGVGVYFELMHLLPI